ncbi:hypothetical protein [Mariniluteicoccus flavus]
MSAYLPRDTIRPARHLGGPLWVGDGNTVGDHALTATIGVNHLPPDHLASLVQRRVQANRIIRFGPPQPASLANDLVALAATNPRDFSLPQTEFQRCRRCSSGP